MDDSPSDSADRAARLSISQLDFLCEGFGHACMKCGKRLPETEKAPRVCPSVGVETCHEVARELHTGGGRSDA